MVEQNENTNGLDLNINWFPGHMAKTRRMIQDNLGKVDLAIELRDARIVSSSQNPEIDKLLQSKPKLVLASKTSLADPNITKMWEEYYKSRDQKIIFYDIQTGENLKNIAKAAYEVCASKIEKWQEKGMEGRQLKAMVLGIPNVGKSSLINKLAQGKKTKVEDRPGVTRDKQWVTTNIGLTFLDMPGVLWPKFEDQTVAENLALTGAIKDQVFDIESLSFVLCSRLASLYPNKLVERYKLTMDDIVDKTGWEIAEIIGKKRGFIISKGEIDYTRTAKMLLDEYRGGKLGRISLERPTDE